MNAAAWIPAIIISGVVVLSTLWFQYSLRQVRSEFNKRFDQLDQVISRCHGFTRGGMN